LTSLRDQLKSGLSQAIPEPGSEAVPVAELSERIKSLKADHTIDAAPERTVSRRVAAEVPVTARIRRRIEPTQSVEPPSGQTPLPSAETVMAEAVIPEHLDEPTPQAEIHSPREMPPPARPEPAYRQQVAQGRRQKGRQLSLF
jgi:hypothetical protein